MDCVSNSPQVATGDSLTTRRLAKGYSLGGLAIATGLTIAEITVADNGRGAANHVERIESVLR